MILALLLHIVVVGFIVVCFLILITLPCIVFITFLAVSLFAIVLGFSIILISRIFRWFSVISSLLLSIFSALLTPLVAITGLFFFFVISVACLPLRVLTNNGAFRGVPSTHSSFELLQNCLYLMILLSSCSLIPVTSTQQVAAIPNSSIDIVAALPGFPISSSIVPSSMGGHVVVIGCFHTFLMSNIDLLALISLPRDPPSLSQGRDGHQGHQEDLQHLDHLRSRSLRQD